MSLLIQMGPLGSQGGFETVCVCVCVCLCFVFLCPSECVFFYLHFACLCFCESPLAEEKEGLFITWASVFVKIKLGCDLKCGC